MVVNQLIFVRLQYIMLNKSVETLILLTLTERSKMKKIFNFLSSWLESWATARAATELTRRGMHEEAKKLIQK